MTYIIIACSILRAKSKERFFINNTNTFSSFFVKSIFLKNLKKKLKALDKRDEDVELSLLEVSLPDTPSVAKLLSSSSHAAIRFEEDDFARALIYRGRWWW
jgi:hypothetical protein